MDTDRAGELLADLARCVRNAQTIVARLRPGAVPHVDDRDVTYFLAQEIGRLGRELEDLVGNTLASDAIPSD